MRPPDDAPEVAAQGQSHVGVVPRARRRVCTRARARVAADRRDAVRDAARLETPPASLAGTVVGAGCCSTTVPAEGRGVVVSRRGIPYGVSTVGGRHVRRARRLHAPRRRADVERRRVDAGTARCTARASRHPVVASRARPCTTCRRSRASEPEVSAARRLSPCRAGCRMTTWRTDRRGSTGLRGRGAITWHVQFKGKIELDVRDSTADWPAFLADKAPEGAPNVLVVLYDDTGQAAWSPYGGRINMPTMDRLAAERADLLAVAHDGAVLADALDVPDRPQPPPRTGSPRSPSPRPGSPATTRTSRRRTRRWRTSCATPAGRRSGSARTTTCRSTSGRWAPRRRTGRSARATTASTGSSAARPTTGIRASPRTTTTSTSRTCPRTATTCRRTSPTRRCG